MLIEGPYPHFPPVQNIGIVKNRNRSSLKSSGPALEYMQHRKYTG